MTSDEQIAAKSAADAAEIAPVLQLVIASLIIAFRPETPAADAHVIAHDFAHHSLTQRSLTNIAAMMRRSDR